VFSPYYAWSKRQDPLNHCAINIALYGKPGARWAMTERNRHAVTRAAERLAIGPSSLAWEGGTLVITVDEIGAPLPRRVRGTIRVTPQIMPGMAFPLDESGRHVWQPIAPQARIEVALEHPALRWHGSAYLDSNYGAEPLAEGFADWNWSRAHTSAGPVVLYDAMRRDGTPKSLALRFASDGAVTAFAPPAEAALPKTKWLLARGARSERPASVQQTLEDTPFYARSLLTITLGGETVAAMHESLSLDRFRASIVQAMLPFRMPRRFF
jgi:carotenoid 1,2-hydratase